MSDSAGMKWGGGVRQQRNATDVTVLMATRNGAAVLPRVLARYAEIAGHDSGWKMIAVDNGSTDATPAILCEWRDRLPLTVLDEPLAGKNRALNRALSELEGEFVILTDDDALPRPGYLDAWRHAISSQRGYDLFGGTVLPLFEARLPDWHMRSGLHFDALFAVNARPDGAVDPSFIFGPNMAVRMKVFSRELRFRDDIGPNALIQDYAMGSESAFCDDACRLGFKFWFAATPAVEHIVRPGQVTRPYFRARAYRLGRGLARRQWLSGELVPKVRRSLPVFAAGLARRRLEQARLWTLTFAGSDEKRFEREWEYDLFRGFHDEYERLRLAYRTNRSPLLAGSDGAVTLSSTSMKEWT